MEKLKNQYGKIDAEGNPIVEDTRGKQKREEVYAEQISQGYEFKTNSPTSRVEEDVRNLEGIGLETFVEKRAFARNGAEIPSYKAILVRERKE
ncbi:MAG TPA: hypothetical protein VJ208_01275 [Candidatus Nanoarchaeia archaeon]|nr:hypothetical protein [Candidatus Nanoarchaeia archaeon]